MSDRVPEFDRAVNRLARVMAITQVSLGTEPRAALFRLNLPALAEAVEALESGLEAGVVPSDYVVQVDPTVLGRATAGLIADSIASPTPDTIPEEWT